MAGLNSAELSLLIKNKLLAAGYANEDDGSLQGTSDSIAEGVIEHVKDKLKIFIPIGEVIIAVTGGGGAPAVGVPNTVPIECEFI